LTEIYVDGDACPVRRRSTAWRLACSLMGVVKITCWLGGDVVVRLAQWPK